MDRTSVWAGTWSTFTNNALNSTIAQTCKTWEQIEQKESSLKDSIF